MLPFYVSGIWLSGSEGRRQFLEKSLELLLSHSCFNSSRGGRGNTSMYVHSLLQSWHGRRNNVFQLSEWLPEQSTYSAEAPQLHLWSWEGCGYLLKIWAGVLCNRITTGNEFMGLWCLIFIRPWKQLLGSWSSCTWNQQNLISFNPLFIFFLDHFFWKD